MGGDEFRVPVGSEQSRGTLSFIAGVMHGGGPPLHVHKDEDEVVIVVQGELAYELAERRGRLGAGGLLWMPRGDAAHYRERIVRTVPVRAEVRKLAERSARETNQEGSAPVIAQHSSIVNLVQRAA
jgi:hypothetical protein